MILDAVTCLMNLLVMIRMFHVGNIQTGSLPISLTLNSADITLFYNSVADRNNTLLLLDKISLIEDQQLMDVQKMDPCHGASQNQEQHQWRS